MLKRNICLYEVVDYLISSKLKAIPINNEYVFSYKSIENKLNICFSEDDYDAIYELLFERQDVFDVYLTDHAFVLVELQ